MMEEPRQLPGSTGGVRKTLQRPLGQILPEASSNSVLLSYASHLKLAFKFELDPI